MKERLASALDGLGLARALLAARSRFGSPWLTVLSYHRVSADQSTPFDQGVVDASPESFERQVEFLARNFDLVGTDELCAFAGGARLPRNPLAITFDDGYLDNFEHALPILSRHGARAIFFIATSYVAERRVFWWDRVCYLVKHARHPRGRIATPAPLELDFGEPARAIHAVLRLIKDAFDLDLARLLDELTAATGTPWDDAIERRFADQLVMSWDQVRALSAAGMDVESHTATHRPLKSLPLARVVAELGGSRATLERELGRPVRALSYPVGQAIADRPPLVAAARAAGYRIGFTNATGVNLLVGRADPFDLRRLPVDFDMPDPQLRGRLALPYLG